MNTEKRMAGDYEIIHAMHIGDTEIVVGENPTAAEGHRYMSVLAILSHLLLIVNGIF